MRARCSDGCDTEFATVESLREKHPTRVTPDILGQLADLQKRLQGAKRRLGAAVKGRQPAAIEAQTTQAQEMLVQLTSLGAAISPRALTLEDRGVPLWLQIGAGHFLAGDYAGALDALDDGPPEGPAELHVHLLRAAAQHALYVRSGEKDTALSRPGAGRDRARQGHRRLVRPTRACSRRGSSSSTSAVARPRRRPLAPRNPGRRATTPSSASAWCRPRAVALTSPPGASNLSRLNACSDPSDRTRSGPAWMDATASSRFWCSEN